MRQIFSVHLHQNTWNKINILCNNVELIRLRDGFIAEQIHNTFGTERLFVNQNEY